MVPGLESKDLYNRWIKATSADTELTLFYFPQKRVSSYLTILTNFMKCYEYIKIVESWFTLKEKSPENNLKEMEVYELPKNKICTYIYTHMLNKLRKIMHKQNENIKKNIKILRRNFGAEEYNNWVEKNQ